MQELRRRNSRSYRLGAIRRILPFLKAALGVGAKTLRLFVAVLADKHGYLARTASHIAKFYRPTKCDKVIRKDYNETF